MRISSAATKPCATSARKWRARSKRLAAAHAAGGHTHYYAVRDQRFNPLRDERRGADGRIAYSPELAAMLIYLNRTGFNGLFRLNASGGFNVPAGRYARPAIVNRARLLGAADALSSPGVRLVLGSFESARDVAEAGDFLYVDPPYVPLSRTARFPSCTASLRRGRSGATAAARHRRRAAGLRTLRVPARRAINSNASRRGTIDEYLITNIDVRADQAPASQTS